jgi:hypothetical protein
LIKILNFMQIRDPGSGTEKFGSGIRDPGWKKFGSRIRHSGWKKFRSGIQDLG